MSRTLVVLLLAIPAGLLAESVTPSIRFTGAPTDGGQNCSLCHSSFGAANSDTAGTLTVTVDDYTPTVQQMIHVTVQHPSASKWGFQITIRQVNDETKTAGTLSPADPVQVRCDNGSTLGSAGPCGLTREFAEHSNAPVTTKGAGFRFDVPWTPPATEVGILKVYVSAVAADADNTAAGDRVYTFSKTISAVGACSISKKPTLTTAVNAASFLQPFSSNSMISIFGIGFQVSGLTRTAGLGDFVNGAFPPTLACIAVEVAGPGIAQPVRLPITYVQQDQINAQAPTFTGTGPVSLTVILNPGKSNEIRSDIATLNSQQLFAPAFFTLSPTKSIAAQFAGTADVVASPSVIPGAKPAKPGDLITLYGTGFGDTDPSVGPGQIDTGVARLKSPITVTIGGVTLATTDVLYAGLSPQSISGLYQFNVRVPASTPDGDIPVTIAIGSSQTQPGAFIPIQR
jgi:uncharacterized protein (TIGR03437 family)